MSRSTRRCFLHFSLACAAAVAAGETPAQAQFRRESVLPTSGELSRIGLERAWWSQATLNSGSDLLVYLTADEDAVYAQSRSGILSAFDAETGKRMWARLLGEAESASYPVVTNSDQVLLATGMNLFAIEKRTGRQLWHLTLPHHPSTAPGIDATQAYVGTLDGSAYAYDLAKIRELYEEQKLPEWTNLAQVWRYSTGTEVSSPPIATGRNIVFASLDGSLYAISRKDGKLAFQFETNGAIRTPVGRDQAALYVASDDVRFFSIDVNTGRLRWTFVPGLPIRKQPRIVEGDVYVAPERAGLYSLSSETGLTQWHQGRGVAFLAATNDRVFASDDLGNVLILSRTDGAIISVLPMPTMTVRVSNDRTDRIFLATTTGVVLALKEAGSGFPRYHKFPERQPILPLMGPGSEDENAEATSGSKAEGAEVPDGAAQAVPNAE